MTRANDKLSVEQRFWQYVDVPLNTRGKPDERACWIWKGAREKFSAISQEPSYGMFGVDGKVVKAHRFVWELHYGKVMDGMMVQHQCPYAPNPACVNVRHLKIGTNADNMKDKVRDGSHRNMKGVKNLTHEQALEVHKMRHEKNMSTYAIGKLMGRNPTGIGKVIRGDSFPAAHAEYHNKLHEDREIVDTNGEVINVAP